MMKEPSLASDVLAATTAKDAWARLCPLLGGRLLLASDFDGTLARMATDPWAATIIPAARRALRRLAARPDVHVAFISGRTVADLAARTRVGGASYHGDHGAEWATLRRGGRLAALRVERDPVDPRVLAVAERLKVEVPRRVNETWLVLEDKGPALTFHFRAAPDHAVARERVIAAVDAVDRERLLWRVGGTRAHELRPVGATTKAATLSRLIEVHRPTTTLMLGDDRHDANAFDALRKARDYGRTLGLAIAVGGHADVTAEVAPHADLILAGPEDAAVFLRLLADVVCRMESPSAHDG
jgi:trehalose-phosphatase